MEYQRQQIVQCLLIFFWILIRFNAVTHQQSIYIKDHSNVSFLVERKCKQILVHHQDFVQYHSQVNLSGNIDSLIYVNYEVERQGHDNDRICFLDLTSCQGYRRANCYCLPTKNKDEFDVVINITALVRYSEATIRGRLLFDKSEVYSNVVELPFIYDPDGTYAALTINNEPMNLRQCNITFISTHIVLVFNIKDKINLPYQLSIEDKDTGHSEDVNSTILSFATQLKKNHSFIMSYTLCGLPKLFNSFTCNIMTTTLIDDTITIMKSNTSSLIECDASLFILQKEDTLSFVSEIWTPGGLNNLESAQITIRKPYNFLETICYVHLNECERFQTPPCTCIRKEEHYFQIGIYITMSQMSQANLMGRLSYLNGYINSDVLTLPTIYDINEITAFININNEEKNTTTCEHITNSSWVYIVFYVNNFTNTPYELEILDRASDIRYTRKSNILTMYTHIYDNHTFILTLKVCNSREVHKSFICIIQPDVRRKNDKDNSDIDILIWLSILLALSFCANIVFILKVCRDYWKKRQNIKYHDRHPPVVLIPLNHEFTFR